LRPSISRTRLPLRHRFLTALGPAPPQALEIVGKRIPNRWDRVQAGGRALNPAAIGKVARDAARV